MKKLKFKGKLITFLLATVVFLNLTGSTASAMELNAPSTNQTFDMLGDVQLRSYPDEMVFGDWQIVRYIGDYSHTFTREELLRRDIIEQTIFYGLGSLTAGSAYLLGVAKSIYEYRVIDVVAIGGVYTKKYQVRKIVDPSTATANVPVPYEFETWTIFYSTPFMKNHDIVHIEKISDGIKLARN